MKAVSFSFIFLSSIILSSIISLSAHAGSSVYLEEMTWMEIKQRMDQGARTVIVPTGSTEQNGPQMVTGKHNVIVRYTAGEIAKRLGNALVAPVVPYAPAGRIQPADGHMQFPGTVSLSDKAFAGLLEDVARSLKQHGFRLICFIGDHGGNQKPQQEVAGRLTDEWSGDGVMVLHVGDYYGNNGQKKWGEKNGLKVPNPEAHAGHIDTSEMLALDAKGVRDSMRGVRAEKDYRATGATGDSSQASASAGRKYLALKIDAAVKQIKHVGPPP